MRAYKGFHKDLNCTMGKGVFITSRGNGTESRRRDVLIPVSMRQTIHWKY